MTNPAVCEGCADVRDNGGSTCGDCGTFLALVVPRTGFLSEDVQLRDAVDLELSKRDWPAQDEGDMTTNILVALERLGLKR